MAKWEYITDQIKTGVTYIYSPSCAIVASTINPEIAKYIVDGMNTYEAIDDE